MLCRDAADEMVSDTALDIRRLEALLAAERDRGRMLEAHCADAEQKRQDLAVVVADTDAAATEMRNHSVEVVQEAARADAQNHTLRVRSLTIVLRHC
jgi:hypothetical protein